MGAKLFNVLLESLHRIRKTGILDPAARMIGGQGALELYRILTVSDPLCADVLQAGVVDDEGSIREITRQTLEAFGYRVVTARKHMNSDVRVVAASGLGANGGVARAASLDIRHFLPKPYTAESLLTMLREALKEGE